MWLEPASARFIAARLLFKYITFTHPEASSGCLSMCLPTCLPGYLSDCSHPVRNHAATLHHLQVTAHAATCHKSSHAPIPKSSDCPPAHRGRWCRYEPDGEHPATVLWQPTVLPNTCASAAAGRQHSATVHSNQAAAIPRLRCSALLAASYTAKHTALAGKLRASAGPKPLNSPATPSAATTVRAQCSMPW